MLDPIQVELNNGLKLYSIPPPGSGIILAYILNIMENYNVSKTDATDPLMYHRLVESFKYGYAYRSQLGDPSDSNITRLVNQVLLFEVSVYYILESHHFFQARGEVDIRRRSVGDLPQN